MHKLSGLFFFLASTVVVMGIITAEVFYPGYSVSLNMISNLGATPPPHSIVREPSAIFFDTSMLLAGILILGGAYFLKKTQKQTFFTTSTILMGLGALGVGIFPAFHPLVHPISALFAFLFGGISAVLSYKVTASPFRFVAVILGGITLVFLFVGIFLPHLITPTLGIGGTERWVAYPSLLWLLGFGGYLMGSSSKK